MSEAGLERWRGEEEVAWGLRGMGMRLGKTDEVEKEWDLWIEGKKEKEGEKGRKRRE